MSLATRRILVMVLLASGALLALLLPAPPVAFGWVRWVLLILAVGVTLIPTVQRRVFPLLERLRAPDPARRWRIALLISVLAGLYFLWTAHWQDRDFFPKTHDEQSYLLQMRMVAQGRLWMPAHPLADFFDTFHVIVEPVYASAYFPGTTLMFTPGLWLGWPVWLLPLIASAACVGLVYRITTELTDGLCGVLAAVVMVSLTWFRMLSILLMGQVPTLLLGLLMFWAFLRWRRSVGAVDEPEVQAGGAAIERGPGRWGWAAMIGAFAGWMAITRPVDALAYALAVGAGILWVLYRRHAAPRLWGVSILAIVLAAMPFLVLQLVLNRNITGSFTTTPFQYYNQRDQPHVGYGFGELDPSVRPVSGVPQKQALYDQFIVPRVREHTPANLPANWGREYLKYTFDTTLPARPLLVLVPVGLLGLSSPRRLVLFATLPVFVFLYAFYTFYLEHYLVVVAPAMILLLVLALRVLEEAWPRWRATLVTGISAGIIVASLSYLPEVDHLLAGMPQAPLESEADGQRHRVTDETFRSGMLRVLRTELPEAIGGRAVVLVRWSPGGQGGIVHQEPVYNTEAAWPDENRIIFAHDLGPERNREIFRYYARHQPGRVFYHFDRSTFEITELGRAEALARRSE